MAKYKSEQNKHLHSVSRRFFIDRAAATKTQRKRFKEWYYVVQRPEKFDAVTWYTRKTKYDAETARRQEDMYGVSQVDEKFLLQKELHAFLDCNGVPLRDQGKFVLPAVDETLLCLCSVDFVLSKWGDPPEHEHDAALTDDWNDTGDDESPFDDEGRFVLPTLDPFEIDSFIAEHLPDPTRLMAWRGVTRAQHEINISMALERLLHFNSLRFTNAEFRNIPLRVEDADLDHERGKQYYETPVVFDSGASFGLSPFINDFISYEETNITVKGVASENTVVGYGTVLYRCIADDGSTCFIPGLAYHLPSTDIRLFSPQAYFQHYGGFATIDADSVQIHLKNSVTDPRSKHIITLPIDAGCNLPLFRDAACTAFEQKTIGRHFRTFIAGRQALDGQLVGTWNCTLLGDDADNFFGENYQFRPYQHVPYKASAYPAAVTVDNNPNLSGAQKEVLAWHHKLACGFNRVQNLMKGHSRTDTEGRTIWHPPVIPIKTGSAGTCTPPKCGTCGIASAKAKGSVSERVVKVETDVMSKNKLLPGELVSMDSIVISIPGRPFDGRGGNVDNYYCGATIFHDAATNIVKVYPQVSLSASDTLLSKNKFESYLWDTAAIRVKHYHSDQGIFVSKKFKDDCASKLQEQSFSAVGAKWQNGFAESAVKLIFWRARHMLLHASLHWSSHDADNPALWPQAVEYATWIHNRLPATSHGYSPLELLTRSKSDHADLLRCHTFGCPTYVLTAKLQDKQKIPKFAHRARLSQFLGYSDQQHSSTAALVRHLGSNNLSTQLHVVFDDKFETVFGMLGSDDLDNAVTTVWERLFQTEGARDWYVDLESDSDDEYPQYNIPFLEDMWLSPTEVREKRRRLNDLATHQKQERLKFEKELVPDAPQPDLHVRFDDGLDVVAAEPTGDLIDFGTDDTPPDVKIGATGSVDDGLLIDLDFDTESPPAASTSVSEGGSDVINETTTWESRLRRKPKPSLKAREAYGNVATTLPSNSTMIPGTSLTTTSETPSPCASTDTNLYNNFKTSNAFTSTSHGRQRRPTIDRTTWHRALTFSPAEMASLTAAEKDVLWNERYRSDFGKYSLTLQTKREPIGVQQAFKSTTNCLLSYKASQARSANTIRSMLLEVDTIEDLLTSPLSEFITLAVNDCIYTGPELTPVCQEIHPQFLSAKTGLSKDDNPGWSQAMAGDEAPQYWEAAKTEIATLEKMSAWDVIDEKDVPKGKSILGSLWCFKRKRSPSGVIKKYKARLTARGDMQVEGVDFSDTWAPVCNWTTVRLMFTLQLMLGLASASADISCAFLHATMEGEDDVYMKMPRGFEQPGVS
jgi:hypothetical protein